VAGMRAVRVYIILVIDITYIALRRGIFLEPDPLRTQFWMKQSSRNSLGDGDQLRLTGEDLDQLDFDISARLTARPWRIRAT